MEAKDEEMADEINDEKDEQTVRDEEMQEALVKSQMMVKTHLFCENQKEEEDIMDYICSALENGESQETEIETTESEVTSTQEMGIQMTGLEVISIEEMEIEATELEFIPIQEMETEARGLEVTSIQSVDIGAAQHQPFPPIFFNVAAPVHCMSRAPVRNFPPAHALLPTCIHSSTPAVFDPPLACRIVFNPVSGSTTHAAAFPEPVCSISPVPYLALTEFVPAPTPVVPGPAPITTTSIIQVPIALKPIPAPAIRLCSAFLLAPVAAADSALALTQTQHLEIATASSNRVPTSKGYHEPVTAATNETLAPNRDSETVGARKPCTATPKIQCETISTGAVGAPTVVKAPITLAHTAVKTLTPIRHYDEAIVPISRTPSSTKQCQTITAATLKNYTLTRHVETTIASSSRVPAPKRPLEPDVASRANAPSPKRVARTIAPIKRFTALIASINSPKDMKGKEKAIETEVWSDNDEDSSRFPYNKPYIRRLWRRGE